VATTTEGLWDRLAREADEVLGPPGTAVPPDHAVLTRLELADRVVRETLRLHPAGSFAPRDGGRRGGRGPPHPQGHPGPAVAVPRRTRPAGLARLAQRLHLAAPTAEVPAAVGMVVSRPKGGAPMRATARHVPGA
jgi:hypothetical protein